VTTSSTPTAKAISPDSGQHWAAEGAWRVEEGIYRIPLPLPMDGLRAVNVYVVEGESGITLIDGGWAIDVAREIFERSLRSIGYGLGDIDRFLVTHAHRDHYTMARVIGTELGTEVALGEGERPGLEVILGDRDRGATFLDVLTGAGAAELAESWAKGEPSPDMESWRYPDRWLANDDEVTAGNRTLTAVHTPGHTDGHMVFTDLPGGLLFAGDHVLPTITPSIGFAIPVVANPLGDFMASLTKVRGLPDLRLLPAHGPLAPSSHARVDELLEHHDVRLAQCLAALDREGATSTARDVAGQLGWTRHQRALEELDTFNRGMAIMETKAHLDLLVARGDVARTESDGVFAYAKI
jgi:glyoxylase-like metal-dependent hydrolase (beta-lactamase superfamily II)